MSDLSDIPLPFDPEESCTLNDEEVTTRLDTNPEEEITGTLFNRDCTNLDTTIPRRKDHFIDCPELPDVPKVLLKNRQFNEVEFPGVPLAEIPKRLLAHLLPCCLEGRSAGFDFDVEEELDSNGEKVEIDFETDLITKTFTIQFGSEGFSYLRLGLNIKPELCFCDENCGDRDYVHLSVNLGAEYSDENTVQDPDLIIGDEQLTRLFSRFGGGGGGGNPICAQKMFAVYQGNGSFMPWGGTSEVVSAPVSALVAPYLANSTLIQNAIYKLEYFCEYDNWYVTDGACSATAPIYTNRTDRVTTAEGLANSLYEGYFLLDSGNASELSYVFNSEDSTTLEADAFVEGISFTIAPGPNNNPRHAIKYSFTLKEGAAGTLIYYATVVDAVSCRPTTYRLIIKVKEIPVEEEENEPEEEQQSSGD